MTRRVCAALLGAVLFAGGSDAAAQVRTGRGTSRSGPAGDGHGDAPGTRTTVERMVRRPPFEPRAAAIPRVLPRMDGRRFPLQLCVGVGWASFGYVPVWLLSDVAPYGLDPIAVPAPDESLTGGVQLDVEPWRAQVYVDGVFAGEVSDFRGYYHHLPLAAGPHRITIVAPSYEPLVLDVMVSPGRTTTYRGALSRAYGR